MRLKTVKELGVRSARLILRLHRQWKCLLYIHQQMSYQGCRWASEGLQRRSHSGRRKCYLYRRKDNHHLLP